MPSLVAKCPNRHFGGRQGANVRAIDELAASLVNDALEVVETINPDDLDAMVASSTPCDLITPTSSVKDVARHIDHAAADLVGRLWDLSTANRQLARRPSHASFNVICVWDPHTKKPLLFEHSSLALDTSASILGFNWVSAALACVLVPIFWDDYTVFEVGSLKSSCSEVV